MMRLPPAFTVWQEPLRGIRMHVMQWVQSGGGPLIVIPVETAHLWRGNGGIGFPMATCRWSGRLLRLTLTMDVLVASMTIWAC